MISHLAFGDSGSDRSAGGPGSLILLEWRDTGSWLTLRLPVTRALDPARWLCCSTVMRMTQVCRQYALEVLYLSLRDRALREDRPGRNGARDPADRADHDVRRL